MKQYCYNYPKPSVTTDCILIKLNPKPELLLIKRKQEPFMDHWALPGGFVEIDEDLQEGAERELAEETNITGISLKQWKTFGRPGRDPRGRTISIVYFGLLDNDRTIRAGDDAADVDWFSITDLPKLAFDHSTIIEEFKSHHQDLWNS